MKVKLMLHEVSFWAAALSFVAVTGWLLGKIPNFSAQQYLKFEERVFTKYCQPLYADARSHSDSLTVDMFRPMDGRHGTPCIYMRRLVEAKAK